MHVELQNASLKESDVDYLKDINVRFEEGLNVLLGPTLSGKTSLMRALAGLETLDEGRVLYEDKDMSGIAVQKRNIAMVYQQFINYPGLTVYENIASPLRILKKPKAVIDEKVRWAASVLKLDNMLDRMPLELSGGQQQRCALARAIVKEAQLVLLDEPLANLDYKLREELRDELPQIFAQSQSVLIYATSEPEEALKLNGKIAVMHEGTISQFGSTNEVYHQPQSLQAAEIFSDPPMNFVDVEVNNGALVFSAQTTNHEYTFEKVKGVANGKYKAGFRPNHLTLVSNNKSSTENETVTFTGHTIISELTGSMSYIHIMANTNDRWQLPLADNQHRWVSLNEGIHHVELDKSVQCNVILSNIYLYQTSGELVFSADARRGQNHG